ncbi:MAG: XRE family transcriptional regulator [Pedobacter sp.]|nr:MAG: XRE family transcriptional regulator [Pedobacter sp.]
MEGNNNIIGRNVRAIRKLLGLSVFDFSTLTELSRATIVNIESGKRGLSIHNLDKICHFTNFKLSDLTNKNFQLKGDIRERLIKHYQKDNAILNILSKAPDISYAISFKLLKSDFLDTPREIREIRAFISKTFKWTYKGTSISTTLKRMPELIKIEPHPTKKNTFLYSKIK